MDFIQIFKKKIQIYQELTGYSQGQVVTRIETTMEFAPRLKNIPMFKVNDIQEPRNIDDKKEIFEKLFGLLEGFVQINI